MMPDDMNGVPGATLAARDLTETRTVAADILTDLRGGELLDAAFDRRVEPLESRDRRWIQELVYGMLRRRGWIDGVLTPRVRGGIVRLDADLVDVLRLGVNQLLFMRSVPPYAAIAQSVELAKRRHGLGASKLANAVLRRVDREREQIEEASAVEQDDPVETLCLRYSHPPWLVTRWIARWGVEETERLLASNNEEAPLFVRPFGVVREQLEAALERSGVSVADAPLVADSIRLSGGIGLTELGAYRQGLFYVQDPGATLVSRYAAFPAGGVVADVCAAPGGKSLEIARSAALVVAADRAAPRLQRMQANLTRLDVRNVALVAMDATTPALANVDAVLVDAPCTGTGTFRRHPDARWRLKISDLAVLTAVQQSILTASAALVKPGGLLVYSTCSLEPEENETQIDSFLTDQPEWRLEPPPAGSVPESVLDAGRLRVWPPRDGADGAFAARLRRVPA